MPRATLAKTSSPRLHNMLARERLFALLDEGRNRPALWIGGPPGSGKTVLAASYAKTNQLPLAWYQLDSGDGELATFFYYFRLATASITKKRRTALPLLAPEYAADVVSFGRRYFRELSDRLPAQALLVFDNYQEVPTASEFHNVIAAALTELPRTINILVTSRVDPPAQFARALASEHIALIDSHALQLNLEETISIARLRGQVDLDVIPIAVRAVRGLGRRFDIVA